MQLPVLELPSKVDYVLLWQVSKQLVITNLDGKT